MVCTVVCTGESLLHLQTHLSLSISAIKVLQTLSFVHKFTDDMSKTESFAAEINWTLIYVLLTLATTLLSTLLIIYCIVWHTPMMNASHKIIQMLIESCTMYSLSLIIYLALRGLPARLGLEAAAWARL